MSKPSRKASDTLDTFSTDATHDLRGIGFGRFLQAFTGHGAALNEPVKKINFYTRTR